MLHYTCRIRVFVLNKIFSDVEGFLFNYSDIHILNLITRKYLFLHLHVCR